MLSLLHSPESDGRGLQGPHPAQGGTALSVPCGRAGPSGRPWRAGSFAEGRHREPNPGHQRRRWPQSGSSRPWGTGEGLPGGLVAGATGNRRPPGQPRARGPMPDSFLRLTQAPGHGRT